MNKLIYVLIALIGYDFSLHLVELLGIQSLYPLWPFFPTRDIYTIFWTAYWGIAFLISLYLLIKWKKE